MSWLKIGGGIAAGLALLWLVSVFTDRARLAALDKDHRACVTAAKSATTDVVTCDPVIGAAVTAARQAAACEAALGAQAPSLFTIQATCGARVKQLFADRDAAIANLADAEAVIAKSGVDRDAAVLRAEARASTIATRKADNDRTIQTAPRTAGGGVHCDAECLRQLAGD